MSFRLFDLNEEQRRAVTTTEGPLLILAGAGTGKTRVITARVAYLIHQGVPPEHILAVTFTNKAAAEMRERLAGMIDPARAKRVTMSTFHALCVRILRSGIDRLGYKKNFSIYDESDQLGLVRKIITRTAAKDEKLEPNTARALISQAKNAGHSAPRDEESLIGAVFARYQADLKTLNAVDFDDLLLLAVKLLSEQEEARAGWQERYRYLMVDEFQDTNRLQLELVTLLAKPIAPEPGRRPNVAVVGDDDQSIYGWRGAEVANILEFEQHFPEPTVVKLEQNYRSTNSVLKAANSIIRHNPRRRPKVLWSEHGEGDKVRIVAAPDDREEAQFVIDDIQAIGFQRKIPWESFAVLYRMNAQSRLLEENLRRHQIPYRLIGGKSFFDRREVKDLLAYAAVLLNPEDDVSLLRIINTPARGLSPATTEKALAFSVEKRISLFQALTQSEFADTLATRTRTSLAAFADLLDRYDTRMNEPLADYPVVMRELVAEIGYLEDLKRTCKTPQEAMNRESRIGDMLADMERHQARSTKGLRGFLDEISLDREREKDREEGGGVTLITMHAAKGLEFPYCYLVGFEDGLIPHERSKLEGTTDEERRLLYVGITRAMKRLTITWCQNRMRYGTVAPCRPSSFLKDFDPELIERENLRELMSRPVEETKVSANFAAMRAALRGG